MRSTITTLIIGLVIVLIVGGGGYLLYNKFKASADVENGNCEQADFNKDSVVNSLDLNMLISAVSSSSQNPKFDLNSDAKVDNGDMDILMKCWSPNK